MYFFKSQNCAKKGNNSAKTVVKEFTIMETMEERNMKKLLVILASLAMVCSMAACSSTPNNDDQNNVPETNEVVLDADLVVVGAGGSGMPATLRATELGLKVVVLEKMSYMGGAMAMSMGNQVVTGSQMQKDLGVTDDSAQSMIDDFMANGANLNVPELISLYAENVGAASDWLSNYVQYNLEGGLHVLAEYSINRELQYVGGGAGGASNLRDAVNNSDAEVLLNTRATELIVDENGAVVGVKATGEDKEYVINAKAVLLSTGGYGANKDILPEVMQTALYYGPVSSTGDGLLMAQEVNAATRLLEYGKRYPNGVEYAAGLAKSTLGGNIAAYNVSAILVNPEGVRVVNEKASNRTVLEAELEQTNDMMYLLMDAASFAAWCDGVASNGITTDDINGWLENNGSTTPIFAHADTIEEVAAIVGMDGATLKATVDTYNGYVDAGEDAEFGRSSDYMTAKIGDGPYYLVEQKARFATTMGGLVVNTSLQVENTNGEVISGLYASGEVVGGVMGDDSPSGANNGWAITSGKLAAESIANALGK